MLTHTKKNLSNFGNVWSAIVSGNGYNFFLKEGLVYIHLYAIFVSLKSFSLRLNAICKYNLCFVFVLAVKIVSKTQYRKIKLI